MITLLTGSTSGIGWETLKGLYKHSDKIILPIRNRKKAQKLLSYFKNDEKIHLYDMDLADLKSVKTCATRIRQEFSQIDLLINNAGGMYPGGKKTNDGLDMTFSVNHLGHFLLTQELMPTLIGGKAKIIHVSSEAHRLGKFRHDDLGFSKLKSTIATYGEVKLYNILMAKELTKRYQSEGLQAYSLHPGAVKTAFGSETDPLTKAIVRASQIFFISAQKGAENSLFLAKTSSKDLKNGAYYVRKKVKRPTSAAQSSKNARLLWEYSENCLGELGLL